MNKASLLLLITTLFLSCNTSKISKQDLLKENQVLKAKIETLKVDDSSKSEAVLEVNNLNIVYRGVRNPLRISFPNAVKINAIGKGLTKKDEYGNYNFTPVSGRTADIIIEAEMIDGTIVRDIKTLRIKNIGKLVGRINGAGCKRKCDILMTKKQFKNAIITSEIDDFLFPYYFKVTEFKLQTKHLNVNRVEGSKIKNNLSDTLEKH